MLIRYFGRLYGRGRAQGKLVLENNWKYPLQKRENESSAMLRFYWSRSMLLRSNPSVFPTNVQGCTSPLFLQVSEVSLQRKYRDTLRITMWPDFPWTRYWNSQLLWLQFSDLSLGPGTKLQDLKLLPVSFSIATVFKNSNCAMYMCTHIHAFVCVYGYLHVYII